MCVPLKVEENYNGGGITESLPFIYTHISLCHCTTDTYVFYRGMLKPKASPFCPPPTQPADWARHEFAGAQLPDQRLNERLCMIATAFAQQPTASIPQACGPGAGSKGAYRFFENESLAPHTIRQAHHQATLARVRTQAVVL